MKMTVVAVVTAVVHLTVDARHAVLQSDNAQSHINKCYVKMGRLKRMADITSPAHLHNARRHRSTARHYDYNHLLLPPPPI